MNKQEMYKSNQHKAKVINTFAPIVFWVCIALAFVFFVVAISESVSNLNEIYDKLDSNVYNDEQLAENYIELCDKYGEWVVGKGTSGFTLHFINFKGAIFSAVIVSMAICSEVFLLLGFLFGKWLMPYWSKKLEQSNQDMVNLTILEKADKE